MDILNKSHTIHRNGDAEKLLKLVNVAVLEAIHSVLHTTQTTHKDEIYHLQQF